MRSFSRDAASSSGLGRDGRTCFRMNAGESQNFLGLGFGMRM